jgi:hypothetical protein
MPSPAASGAIAKVIGVIFAIVTARKQVPPAQQQQARAAPSVRRSREALEVNPLRSRFRDRSIHVAQKRDHEFVVILRVRGGPQVLRAKSESFFPRAGVSPLFCAFGR